MKDLNEYYYNLLTNLTKTNEEIKQKADKYYKDNIQLEKELYDLRLDSKQKKDELQEKINENNDIYNNIQFMNNQKKNILENLNNKQNSEDNNDNDIKNLCTLINKLFSLGYNLDKDDITESEKQNLDNLLKKNDINQNNSEIKLNKNNQNNEKEQAGNIPEKNELNRINFELGNTIVSLIERDVNDLYMRKLIEQIKIDQIDAITYSFSGEKTQKKITFKVENNNLICSTGETFTVWLIKNFSL